MTVAAKLRQFYNSPTGPKTVHFWAPVMKWTLVLAGVGDFTRPASTLSVSQNAALMLTGSIWTRWSLIIIPKNNLLAAVNFLLSTVGAVQLLRIANYRRSLASNESSVVAEPIENKDIAA